MIQFVLSDIAYTRTHSLSHTQLTTHSFIGSPSYSLCLHLQCLNLSMSHQVILKPILKGAKSNHQVAAYDVAKKEPTDKYAALEVTAIHTSFHCAQSVVYTSIENFKRYDGDVNKLCAATAKQRGPNGSDRDSPETGTAPPPERPRESSNGDSTENKCSKSVRFVVRTVGIIFQFTSTPYFAASLNPPVLLHRLLKYCILFF